MSGTSKLISYSLYATSSPSERITILTYFAGARSDGHKLVFKDWQKGRDFVLAEWRSGRCFIGDRRYFLSGDRASRALMDLEQKFSHLPFVKVDHWEVTENYVLEKLLLESITSV